MSGNCWSENTVAIHFPGQYLTNSFPASYGRQLKELVWSMVHPSCIQTLVFISQQCDQVTIFTVVESCQLKKLPRKALQPLVVTTCCRPGFSSAAGTPTSACHTVLAIPSLATRSIIYATIQKAVASILLRPDR